MKARLLCLLMSQMTMISCSSESSIQGGVHRGSAAAGVSGASGAQDDIERPQQTTTSLEAGVISAPQAELAEESKTNSQSATDTDSIILTDAMAPVPVSGGNLTCSFSPSAPLEARCKSFSAAGVLTDYGLTQASLLRGSELTRIDTDMKTVGVGTYTVSIPPGLVGSFAIVLSNGLGQFIADYIIDPNSPVPTLVSEGSFEALTASPLTAANVLFAEQSGSPNWRISSAPGATCPTAVIEIRPTGCDDAGPSNGLTWIELNGFCPADPNLPSNISVSQDVKLVVGNSYVVMFDYRRRIEAAFNGMVFSFGNENQISFSTAPATWTTYRAVYKATTTSAAMMFTGLGSHNNGAGAQLDNVRIYNLGKIGTN